MDHYSNEVCFVVCVQLSTWSGREELMDPVVLKVPKVSRGLRLLNSKLL
jgi:hypothetical protein